MRHEPLDRTLNWNERQFRALLVELIEHYSNHRLHRSLNRSAPNDHYVLAAAAPGELTRGAKETQ